MKKLALTITLLLACLFGAQAQNIVSIPYAESFENGLNGWTAVDGDGDALNWRVVDFSSVPPAFAAALGYFAYDGDKAVYSESVNDNGMQLHVSNWLVSPAMTLPVSDSTQLTWWIKSRTTDANDIYEVRIGVVSDTTVDTLDYFDVLFGDTVRNTGYEQRTVDLTQYAGATVRVAFRHVGGHSSLQLDYVVFGNDSLPIVTLQGPMGVDVNDTVLYTASLNGGSADGLAYEWLCDEADYMDNSTGDSTRIVWVNGGMSRVGVVATNAYGTDTAWMDVAVSNCGVIDSFPFIETFATLSTTRTCWKMLDGDGGGTAWAFTDGDAQSSSITFYGMFPEQDNWLITPPLELGSELRQLSWQVKPNSEDYPAEHYSVLISTGGDVYNTANYTEVFSETLGDPYNWATRYLSLAGYADSTVRIAFRHHGTDDQEYLHLTNVRVEQTGAPIVSLHAPAEAIVGDAVPFTLDTFSVLPINDITWTVWTDTFGTTQTITQPNGQAFTYTWPEGSDAGYYMVAVEVSNDEGTAADTAWVHLRVCEVEEVPYTHHFGTDDECWRFGSGWYPLDSIYVEGVLTAAAISFSHDEYGNDLHADNIMDTPWLYIPDNSYEVRFFAGEATHAFLEEGHIDRFSVVVRTANSADTIYTGVVSGEAYEYRLQLGAYADSTIQIAFRHHDSPMGYGLNIAEVAVMPVAPPVVSISAPQRTRTGVSVSIAAQVVSSETLTYSWQIDGAVPNTASGSPISVQWANAGDYAIRLTVTSPLYGDFSDSTVISVIDCSGIVDVPYTEHFNVDMGCWTGYDLDGDGYGWEMALGSSFIDNMFAPALAYGGAGNSVASWSNRPSGDLFSYIFGVAGTPLNADNLIVSPAMTLPAEGSCSATFHVASIAPILANMLETSSDNLDSFAIMVTTIDDATTLADFTVLLPLQVADSTGFGTYTVSLNAYLGQTVRLAVRHRGNDMVGLLLDEVSVDISAPQYTLTVTAADATMGTVSGGGTYDEGAQALLTASAFSGYRFDHWQDNNTDNPRVVTVTADATYTAYFVPADQPQGIDEVDDDSSVIIYVRDGRIIVSGADGETVRVFDMVGRNIRAATVPAGVYIVKVGSHPAKKVVVLR